MAANKFKTSKQDKRRGSFKLVIIVLICALLIGSVSVAVIFKNNDNFLKDLFLKNETTQAQEDMTEDQLVDLPGELQGQMKILAYSASKDKSEIYFLAVINADMEKPGFEVYPINPDNADYISALTTGGEKGLVAAVESAEGISVDKYVASNTDTFALAINSMGGLEYTVSNRIDYKTEDFTLILTAGAQTIKGETLLKYFRYLKTLGNDGLRQQGELICSMLDSYVTAENVEQGDKIYERILAKIDSKSDISHLEMSKALQMLKIFCKSDKKQPATVIIGK